MNYRAFLALIVVGALSTGCSNTPSGETGSVEKVKYQVITTGETQDRIDILGVATSLVGDLMRASVELKNDSNFSYTFEYRFKWYDAVNMEINPEGTAWTPVAVMANETRSLQATAPNPTAASFKLFLQEKP
jgi:uncharacterized protein YcfL